MNNPQTIIQQSKIIERLILDRNTTAKLGTVDQFWIDPQGHVVEGLICRHGFLNQQKKYISWSQVQTIGEDSILVDSSEKSKQKPGKFSLIIGHELWSNEGNKIGKLVDFVFQRNTGKIQGYLFVKEGWKGALFEGVYILSPLGISSVGDQRILVLQAALDKAEKYQDGLGQQFEQAMQFLQEDYQKTQQEIEATLDATRDKTRQAAERLKDTAQFMTQLLRNNEAEPSELSTPENDIIAEENSENIDSETIKEE
ncbi:PRC-barrel domain-containing protein [Spirulina subsalsa FACHB-351]|uniref:PRC-barrel domain-containing protein n=1 Tax=Spirulina subsalsa FACHB-351 TaxID=234711 RepID=A0ABT3L5D8_9CYAN|nr:PRC-barrel domain-containing protein [Spirulina subsalsa]MCW6036723.1 PRC-barrel domain-containing protein [Spirulina subsalsa FACHB-351]